MIIIPIKWLFHWEYTQHFQTNPYRFRILMDDGWFIDDFQYRFMNRLTMIQWCTIFVLQSMDPLDPEKAQSCIRTNREHGDMVMVGSSCGSCSRSRRCPKSSVWSSVWQERISCAMWVCPFCHAENSDAMQWMFGGSWKRCPKAFAGLHSNLENGWEREVDAIPYTAINPFTLFKAVLSTSPEPNLMKPWEPFKSP